MKKVFFLASLLLSISSLFAQYFEDLSFGTDNSLEVITWNLELFPTNGSTTVEYVSQAISALDADIIAFQEISNASLFIEMINGIEGYTAQVGTTGGDWKLAFAYRTETVEVNSIYQIYTASEFANPFPRRPLIIDFNYQDENYVVINNHFKCCGDGIIDYDNPYDEEMRRYLATNLLKEYVDTYLPNKRVFIVGDLNDEITDIPPNNVFQSILDDYENYLFADYEIAIGSSSNWSYPSWPSHLDHIIITNELFDMFYSSSSVVTTIKLDNHLSGGWYEYNQNISDHRPVAIKLSQSTSTIFDKDFEDQSLTSGGWSAYSLIGDQTWYVPSEQFGNNYSYCAYINGYNSGAQQNEDWFVSPAFNPDAYNNLEFSFWNTSGYTGPQLQVFYSYNFTDNPSSATWTEIAGINWHSGSPYWQWTFTGAIDLSNLSGTSANIAFKYTSTTSQAAAWEIDDILLTGQIKTFTIAASANPSNGGVVSGHGIYELNHVANLSAIPATGYSFVNWTEGGTVVSSNANYSFPVTEDRTLVANFAPQTYTIYASVQPAGSGTINGAGTYNHGQTAVLSATPLPNYSFVSWTENGNVVSMNATYSFQVNSNRDLVANFIAGTFVNSHESNLTISIYPNPFADQVIFELEEGVNMIKFEILNSIGEIVHAEQFIGKIIIETDHFAPGVYIIRLSDGIKFDFYKIIKQ